MTENQYCSKQNPFYISFRHVWQFPLCQEINTGQQKYHQESAIFTGND